MARIPNPAWLVSCKALLALLACGFFGGSFSPDFSLQPIARLIHLLHNTGFFGTALKYGRRCAFREHPYPRLFCTTPLGTTEREAPSLRGKLEYFTSSYK